MRRLAALLCALLLASCDKQDGSVAGTESGTGIQGQLALGNTPVTGADVYLYARSSAVLDTADSAVFLRVLDNPDTLKDASVFKSAVTDDKGAFRFEDLAPGSYALIGLYADPTKTGKDGKWVGFAPRLRVEAKSYTDAGTLALKRLGGISANVSIDHQPAENVKCHVPGLSFVAFTDDAGRCTLLDIPEGAYTVKFERADFLSQTVAAVPVEAGKVTALADTIRLERDPSGPPPSPQNLSFSLDTAARILTLRWDPVQVSDVVGYVVYRKSLDSLFRIDTPPLTDTLLRGAWFTDTLYKSVPDTSGVTYFYRIESSDKDGKASEPVSYEPITLPPAAHPIRLSFASAAYAAREGEGAVVLAVKRSGPAERPVRVKWAFEDSTAMRDSDYVPSTGELAFGAGDTLREISVALVDDRRMEGGETFRVRLERPSDGAVLGENISARVTLADDDSLSVLSCADTVYAVRESDSAAVVTVKRSGEIRRAVTLRYATRAGAAKDTLDYLGVSGTLAFDSGETTKAISIPLVHDTVEERGEDFHLDLSAPSRDAAIQGCASSIIRVADDDSNYVSVPVDVSVANWTHNILHGDPVEWPTHLGDGDTEQLAAVEQLTSAPELLPKPVADWDFSDCGKAQIRDLSGNGHPLSSAQALTCGSDSLGGFVHFKQGDSLQAQDHPQLSFVDSFTVEAWVRPDSLTGLHTIVSKFYAPNSFSIQLVDGEFRFEVDFPDDSTWWGTGPVVAAPAKAGKWQHVAGVYDGRSIGIYVDGLLVKEAAAHGAMMISDRPVTVGFYPSWSTYYGDMRGMRLFAKALDRDGVWEQAHLRQAPPHPMILTAAFDSARAVRGGGVYFSGAAGSTRYRWSLEAADTPEDLAARKGSYVLLVANAAAGADGWARAAFKVKARKLFRYTLTGAGGTGRVRINELELAGAKRVTLP